MDSQLELLTTSLTWRNAVAASFVLLIFRRVINAGRTGKFVAAVGLFLFALYCAAKLVHNEFMDGVERIFQERTLEISVILGTLFIMVSLFPI